MNSRLPSRLAISGAAAALLLVLAFLLKFDPFFGLMDDATLLRQGQQMRSAGFFSVWLGFLKSDLRWGMVRPFYPPMAFFLYGWGQRQPMEVFALNFLFASACLIFYGICWRKVLAPSMPPPRALSSCGFVGAYLLAALAFPWTHDLFLFPSLQEKLVLLGGGGALIFFSMDARAWPAWKFALSSLLVLALGFLTKAQFTMYVPALVVLALDLKPGRKPALGRAAFVGGVAGIMALSLKTVASRGGYTNGRYSISNVVTNLCDSHTILLLATAVGYGLFAWGLARRRGNRVEARLFLPVIVVLGFVAVFLPWTISSYLLSSVGVVLGICVAVCLSSLREGWLMKIALGAVLAVSIVVSVYRSYVFFGHLSDLREVIYSPEIEKISATGKPVYLGCQEGADAFRFYLRAYRGLSVDVQAIGEAPADGKGYYVGDSKLCPLLGIPVKALFPPTHHGGFGIYGGS